MMATHLLSRYEREYIVSGVNEDFRADGRTCRDFRHFSLESGVVSNTSGSAKIQLDRTSVIVGVKAELGASDPEAPDMGRIQFFVDWYVLSQIDKSLDVPDKMNVFQYKLILERGVPWNPRNPLWTNPLWTRYCTGCMRLNMSARDDIVVILHHKSDDVIICTLDRSSALASPEFEGREGEDLGQHLAHKLAEAYQNRAVLDLSSLCVIPGQQCWVLYVDALVLEWSGSVLDALSLAARAALHNTRIPKLTVTGEGEEMEIEVSDNPHDSTPVDAALAPIIITLTRVGNNFVVDASQEEEGCASSRLSLAVNHSGHTVTVTKDGSGGIPFGKLHNAITMAQEVGSKLLGRMDDMLHPTNTQTLGLSRTTGSLFT